MLMLSCFRTARRFLCLFCELMRQFWNFSRANYGTTSMSTIVCFRPRRCAGRFFRYCPLSTCFMSGCLYRARFALLAFLACACFYAVCCAGRGSCYCPVAPVMSRCRYARGNTLLAHAAGSRLAAGFGTGRRFRYIPILYLMAASGRTAGNQRRYGFGFEYLTAYGTNLAPLALLAVGCWLRNLPIARLVAFRCESFLFDDVATDLAAYHLGASFHAGRRGNLRFARLMRKRRGLSALDDLAANAALLDFQSLALASCLGFDGPAGKLMRRARKRLLPLCFAAGRANSLLQPCPRAVRFANRHSLPTVLMLLIAIRLRKLLFEQSLQLVSVCVG